MFNPCIVIPVFNHGEPLQDAFFRLLAFQLQIIIVDDGSDNKTQAILQQLHSSYLEDQVILIQRKNNGGKGAAFFDGLQRANELGFTHVLQIDADIQHDLEDIPKFVALAKDNPAALILGVPIFDDSIPPSRLHGRKFTNMWVCIETLSNKIKDAMCGFRIYPVQAMLAEFQNLKSLRMGFDIEILVRLYWVGVKIINVPTRVIYPKGGSSNFRMLEDNLEITLTHTRLFFGMLARLPKLLKANALLKGVPK
jgi:glycosyltransferase involved in cell wall biosynthesis